MWAGVRCGLGCGVGRGTMLAGVRCGLGCGVGRGAVWAGVRCEPRWGVGRGAVWAEVWCGPGCGVGRGAVWAGVRCGPGCGVVRGGGIGDSDGGRCQECDISKCMQTNGQRVDGKMTSLTQFVVTDPSLPPHPPPLFFPRYVPCCDRPIPPTNPHVMCHAMLSVHVTDSVLAYAKGICLGIAHPITAVFTNTSDKYVASTLRRQKVLLLRSKLIVRCLEEGISACNLHNDSLCPVK